MGLSDKSKRNAENSLPEEVLEALVNIDKPPSEEMWEAFLEKYQPSGDLVEPSEGAIRACENAGLPDGLLDFIKRHGFGNYGEGILKLIDPEQYAEILYSWIGGRDSSRIPFMMTGFGDLFYFRNLGDGIYDVSLLDIHYRRATVPAYTISEFLTYLLDPEVEEEVLRRSLFDSARKKCGSLAADEIYFFAPGLAIGGLEDIQYVTKGKADVHHQLLIQLAS